MAEYSSHMQVGEKDNFIMSILRQLFRYQRFCAYCRVKGAPAAPGNEAADKGKADDTDFGWRQLPTTQLTEKQAKKMNDGQQKCVVAKSNPKSFYPCSKPEQEVWRSLRQDNADSCAECHQQIYKPEGQRASEGQIMAIIHITDDTHESINRTDEKKNTHIIQ